MLGSTKTACVIEEDRVIVGNKKYPMSGVYSISRSSPATSFSISGIKEPIGDIMFNTVVNELVRYRPRATDDGVWCLTQDALAMFKALSDNDKARFHPFIEHVSYDKQDDGGCEGFEFIRNHSRIKELNSIHRRLCESDLGLRWASQGEIRKQCNSCGAVYCFTAEDLKRLAKDARASINASLLQAGGLMTGNFGAAIYGKQIDRKVVDLNRCPICDSSNIVDWDPGTEHSRSISNDGASAAFSAADEILKFKNLADQGIITMDEFEAKKKQLLG